MAFGKEPGQLRFIDLKKEKDALGDRRDTNVFK